MGLYAHHKQKAPFSIQEYVAATKHSGLRFAVLPRYSSQRPAGHDSLGNDGPQ